MKINHLHDIGDRHFCGELDYLALIQKLVPGDTGSGLRLAPLGISYTGHLLR